MKPIRTARAALRWALLLQLAILLTGAATGARAQEAAKPGESTLPVFTQTLLASSLIMGVARTYPQILILDKTGTGDPVVEQYRGNDGLSPSLSLWLLPGEALFASKGDGGSPGQFRTYLTLGGGVDYAGFTGRQALLTTPDGRTGRGTIRGDQLLTSLKFIGWLAWHNRFLPMAWGVSQGLGIEMFQFEGTMEYDGGAGKERAAVTSNGLTFAFALPFELHWQLGEHVRLRWMFTDTVISFPHDATLTQGGGSLGSYQYEHRLSVYTLGYVWLF